ncbi:MAG: glycosyltransferase family 4 protein [Verrucomicrobia bacterium]|nr:glycosyltransferase family 4 protein [Verrucomicrobiota bacterium]
MKILVYDDNPDFGGHQTMACHGVEALASDPGLEVVFMFNPHNKRLADCVSGIPNLQNMEAPCTTRKFQGLRNRIVKTGIHALAREFQKRECDLVLCIQGEIEDSSQAVLAARKTGIECVSYLAIPHPMQLMGAKFGGLRDRINQYLFNQPSRYIAIAESMKQLLIDRGVTQPIAVVPNGIHSPPAVSSHIPQSTSHMTLGLFGRIEFNQKRQDFMVQTFCRFPGQFAGCRLVIAGDGPDAEKLKQLVAKCSRRDDITLMPWQNDSDAFYASLDVLILPSRFEGVPLVMLEALARGIPVIGSARDGMRDILPEAWIFEPENAQSLAKTFSRARESWQSEIDALRQKILAEHSLENFKTGFRKAVCSSL